MSPALDMPLNRREAVASLIAMLAFVLGTGDSAAELAPESAENTELVTQPHPGSSRSWWADWGLCAQDDHLPLPRHPNVETVLVFDGHTLRMDVTIPADWIPHVEQEPTHIGTFIFTGDPGPFLDAISAEGDRAWLKKKLEWAEKPYAFCPVCLAGIKEKVGCTMCGGTGWIQPAPEDARRAVEKEAAKRRRKINRAVERAEERLS